jgi:hypothetical protein
MAFFDIIKKFLPDILELFEFVLNSDDNEFKTISESWPAPIKTKMAKMRFEAKLLKEFPDGGES